MMRFKAVIYCERKVSFKFFIQAFRSQQPQVQRARRFVTVASIVITAVFMTACFAEGRADEGDSFTVTLSVLCDTLLDNMHLLRPESHELVPEDGIIFPPTVVTVQAGDSVFDLLQQEMRNAGIHMAFRRAPVIDAAYIEAINNIYEFDAGPLSGWKFKVNGYLGEISASMHILEPQDVVEWLYTLDLGRDL